MDKFVTIISKNGIKSKPVSIRETIRKKNTTLFNTPKNKKLETIDKIGERMIRERERIKYDVFTDGSCLNNCRRSTKSIGGIGVFWGDNDLRKTAERLLIKPITNNRTELQAIIVAVETFELFDINNKKNNILVIHSDSNYCIKTMTSFIHSWKKRGWLKSNGKEPLNLDLICKLDNLIQKNVKKFKVEFKHVRAHKKEPRDKSSIKHYYWYGNDKADKLARLGGKK